MSYDLGDVVTIGTTTKVAGVLTDATTVTLTVQRPTLAVDTVLSDGTPTTPRPPVVSSPHGTHRR